MMLYQSCVRPLLFQLDPELAHTLTTRLALGLAQLPGGTGIMGSFFHPGNIPELVQSFWGYAFQNPLGLAAGFDKNIRLPQVMRAVGFGFEEAGSVSAQPSLGNPRPRLFRLPQDEAIINRMGLNNLGVEVLRSCIERLSPDWPVGISLVKTHDPAILDGAAIADFVSAFRAVYGLGAYLSLNISCPNTREGKTFEDPEALNTLLNALRQAETMCQAESSLAPRPWCLKVSPDLASSQLQELFDVAMRYDVAGWIACNTTSHREGLKTSASRVAAIGSGGLSGFPLLSPSTRVLGELYQLSRVAGRPQVLMGVGGVHDVDSAWEKIVHGASLIQVYTGLIYEGPGLIRTVCQGLRQKLAEHGFSHVQQAVGSAFR